MSDAPFVPSNSYAFDAQREREYLDYHEIAMRLQYVNQSAPYLANDPEVAMALVNSPAELSQLGQLAGATSAAMQIDVFRADLEAMEAPQQRRVFEQLTEQQQSQLLGSGYEQPGTGRGSNPILSAIGKAGGAALGGVNTVLTKTPVVKTAVDWMEKAGNGINTLYRTIRTDEQAALATALGASAAVATAVSPLTGGLSLGWTAAASAGAGLLAGNVAAASTNPSDYIDSVKGNWDGEAVFSQAAQAEVRSLISETGLETLARDLAWEMDSWETVKLFASQREATDDMVMQFSFSQVLDSLYEMGDPRREEAAQKLNTMMAHPAFKTSVEKLARSKTSFGRDIARAFQLDPSDGMGRYVSGAADMMWIFATDPTLMAGAYYKFNHARRFGMPLVAGEDAFQTVQAISRKAEEIPSIGRAYDEIANAINLDRPHLLWRRVPVAQGLGDDLWLAKQRMIERGYRETRVLKPNGQVKLVRSDWDGVFTRDDIFDYLNEFGNAERMLAGHGVQIGRGRMMLPSYGTRIPFTQGTIALGKPFEGAKAYIDFADDMSVTRALKKAAKKMGDEIPPSMRVEDNVAIPGMRLYDAPTDEWQNVRRFVNMVDNLPGLAQLQRGTAQVIAGFTEMMPATNSISMVGPQAAQGIQRMVGLGRFAGIDSVSRKQWFDFIMQQDNIEHRVNASMSFLETMLKVGVANTEYSDDMVNKFVAKMRQRYGLGNNDQYMLGSRWTSRAIHPYQHAFDLPIPDLSEIRELNNKGVLLKYVHRAVESEPVEITINKIWKPLVLLRIGFITRAAGEELLASLARIGPSTMISEFGNRSLAEQMIASNLDVSNLSPAQRIAVERMNYAAHVRPLERMFSSYDWMSPGNDVLRRYTDWHRGMLQRGLAPGLASRATGTSRELAVLGKEGGIRRALLAGADPKKTRHAQLFTEDFASSILKDVSAQNASVAAELKADDFSMRVRNEADELEELGYVVERGEFRTYTAEGDAADDVFYRMGHASAAKIVSQPLTGEEITRTTARFLHPNVDEELAYSIINRHRSIEDWRLKGLRDELLSANDVQTSTWDSFLETLEAQEPKLADELRLAHRTLGAEQADADAILDRFATYMQKRYRGRGEGGLTQYGDKMMFEINTIRSMIRDMSTQGASERAWLASWADVWGDVPERPELLTSFDDYAEVIKSRMADAHFDPQNQQLVNGLTYANRSRDGSVVARPPKEGSVRVWIPQVSDKSYGRIIGAIAEEGPRDVAAKLKKLWREAQPHLDGVHMAQTQQIFDRFIDRFVLQEKTKLARHAQSVTRAGRHGSVIPLSHMGFDDPIVAERVSQFLEGVLARVEGDTSMAGRMANTQGQVASLDLDDHLRNYWPTDIDGAKRPVAHRQWETKVYDETRDITEMVTEVADAPIKPPADVPPPPLAKKFSITSDEKFDERLSELVARLDPETTHIHFVAGGRDFSGREAMETHLTRVAQKAAAEGKHVIVVEGGARGADSLAGRVAQDLGMNVIEFPANWKPDGVNLNRGAGFQRNELMARFLSGFDAGQSGRVFSVDAALFPGGRGTEGMRNTLSKRNITTYAPATEILQPTSVTSPITRTETTTRTQKLFPKEAERTIHSWALDPEFLTASTVSHADQPTFTFPDGSSQKGIDPRAAIDDGVDAQFKDWVNHITNTDQRRIVRGEAFSDSGHTRLIPPGSELRAGEMVYDAKGNVIEYDDPDVFKHLEPESSPIGIHDNWEMTGPLLRDGMDAHRGTSRFVRDTRGYRNTRGKRTDWVRADEAIRQYEKAPRIRQFRGHWTQMQRIPNAPKVVVAPALRSINTPGKFTRGVEWGFAQGISPAIDAIVRRPLAFHYYTEALTENERALRWMFSKHIFGDEQIGLPGALSDTFGHLLKDPMLTRELSDVANEILEATRVLEPHYYNELVGQEPIDIVNAYYGEYGDDLIAHAEIGRQVGAANRRMTEARRDLIVDRIVNAGPRTAVKQSLNTVRRQTEVRMVRLHGDVPFGADPGAVGTAEELALRPWSVLTPDLPTTSYSIYVDVPADEASSRLAQLRKGEGVDDARPLADADPFEAVRTLDDREIVEGMLKWMGTGRRPTGWDDVSDVMFKKMQTQFADLRKDTDMFEMLDGFSFGEWAEAVAAGQRVQEFPRWSLDVRNNERPIEGILDAYENHLGEHLDKPWEKVQRHLEILPKQLRDSLDADSWGVVSSAYQNRKHATQTARELAAQRAVVNAMPYLDSHELRSQAGEYVRGFFPFMYAEENFLKRWARTIAVAPDAIRKGQLVYSGLKSGGVVRTDTNGRDYVVYPGFGALTDVVNQATQAMGFGDAVLPTGVVFQSETKNLLPGFDVERTGMASANPPLAIALSSITSRFHELRPIQRGLVGDAGVSQGGFKQFVPSTAQRIWRVMQDPKETNQWYASAMMSAIATLEHNGHGSPEGATPNQLDDYNRRVMNHTRGILAVQAVAGFIVPGSPQIAFTGESGLDMNNLTGVGAEMPVDVFRPQFLSLIQELGIEEGTLAYFEANPDHDLYDLMPYTVGQSRSSSGAPLPVTHEAVRWADDNNGWLEQYPNAGAWMLPLPDPADEGDFDQYAYVQQAISGLRQKRTPTEFLEALKFKEGSFDYFRSQEKYEEMRAAETDPLLRKQLTDAWETWRSEHYAKHPVFTEMLQGSNSKQRRQKVISELTTAIQDPLTPDVGHKSAMGELIQVFNYYKLHSSLLSEGRDEESVQRLDQFRLYYQDWVAGWLRANPQLEPLWLSVLEPESDL